MILCMSRMKQSMNFLGMRDPTESMSIARSRTEKTPAPSSMLCVSLYRQHWQHPNLPNISNLSLCEAVKNPKTRLHWEGKFKIMKFRIWLNHVESDCAQCHTPGPKDEGCWRCQARIQDTKRSKSVMASWLRRAVATHRSGTVYCRQLWRNAISWGPVPQPATAPVCVTKSQDNETITTFWRCNVKLIIRH
jgi:hypothetical protein